MSRQLAHVNSAITIAALLVGACVARMPPPVQLTPSTGSFRLVAHAQLDTVPLSSGDVVRGRRAFLDLRCHSCHRVAEDPTLPVATDAVEETLLKELGKYPPEAVAWKIVAQTSMDSEAVYDSPMEEPVSAMSERQLVDIVAYLRDPAAAVKPR